MKFLQRLKEEAKEHKDKFESPMFIIDPAYEQKPSHVGKYSPGVEPLLEPAFVKKTPEQVMAEDFPNTWGKSPAVQALEALTDQKTLWGAQLEASPKTSDYIASWHEKKPGGEWVKKTKNVSKAEVEEAGSPEKAFSNVFAKAHEPAFKANNPAAQHLIDKLIMMTQSTPPLLSYVVDKMVQDQSVRVVWAWKSPGTETVLSNQMKIDYSLMKEVGGFNALEMMVKAVLEPKLAKKAQPKTFFYSGDTAATPKLPDASSYVTSGAIQNKAPMISPTMLLIGIKAMTDAEKKELAGVLAPYLTTAPTQLYQIIPDYELNKLMVYIADHLGVTIPAHVNNPYKGNPMSLYEAQHILANKASICELPLKVKP
jgi:hypothetical protein